MGVTVADVLKEYQERQASPEFSKLGILIGGRSGKLFVFRKVVGFKKMGLERMCSVSCS
jgi:uncharacterized membrane protein YdcZ (DUF606 family)